MQDKSCFWRCAVGLAMGLLGSVTGCSGGRGPQAAVDLVPVSGRVTLDGQPLAGAHVVFEDTDHTFAEGTTNSAGEYALRYSSEQMGARPGRKIVRIRRYAAGKEEVFDGGRSEGRPTGGEPIPARYNVRSVLSATVDAEHQRFEFALQSQQGVTR